MGYDLSDRPLAIEAAMVIEKWRRIQDVKEHGRAHSGKKPKGFEDFGEWDEYVDQRGKIVIGGRRRVIDALKALFPFVVVLIGICVLFWGRKK